MLGVALKSLPTPPGVPPLPTPLGPPGLEADIVTLAQRVHAQRTVANHNSEAFRDFFDFDDFL